MKKVLFFILTLLLFNSCKPEKIDTKISSEKIKEQLSKTSITEKQFSYKPIKPIDGKLKAVVELGASGFNSFVINIDKDKNWEIKSKEYGNSSILDGNASVKEIRNKLKLYIQKIIDLGVASKNIHFVVSSGADKKSITQKIKSELNDIGYKVNVVTAEEEGQYALKSVMTPQFEDTTFVVDIGSGNTKISYIDGNSIVSKEVYGSKYFQKNINDQEVYNHVKAIADSVPEQKRKQYFIIGGVPYQMAKKLRIEKERYTLLNKDISVYQDVISEKGAKTKSGVNIFKAINDATNPETVIFDWDSNFTIGFLLDLTD
ncbi:hypothetical protein ACSIGC_10555 [Tenacibaculum sp. ZS6-P6]|uniref:hypothetical protein n=1 Tax=Tenacibaculum sp. ZS6-P6 TaxID=3447503 RepID=UPI003F9542A1